MAQMKGQIKSPEEELKNMNTSNLSDAEFKTLFTGCSRNLVRTSTA